MLWQLKKLSTNEALNEAGPLPNNWGPIFGMAGVQDKLGDLSWLGEAYADQGWVQIEGELPVEETVDKATEVWELAQRKLRDCDWTMLPDAGLTVQQKEQWVAYRLALRNIRSSAGFPDNAVWPAVPTA